MLSKQCLTGQFPTHPNREFFAALQGIKSGDQGNFHRDQGMPLSSDICPDDKSQAPTISILAETAKKAPPVEPLGLAISACPARLSHGQRPASSSRSASATRDSSTRTIGVLGLTMARWVVSARRPGAHRAHRRRGPMVRIPFHGRKANPDSPGPALCPTHLLFL